MLDYHKYKFVDWLIPSAISKTFWSSIKIKIKRGLHAFCNARLNKKVGSRLFYYVCFEINEMPYEEKTIWRDVLCLKVVYCPALMANVKDTLWI